MSEKIPAIYHYCDRWCGRCMFTSRCAVYKDESEINAGKLGTAADVLQKAADHPSADHTATGASLDTGKEYEAIRIQHGDHPLSELTLRYVEVAHTWLKTQPGMLDRLDSLKTGLTLGIESTEQAKKETETIKDSLAVIQWYTAFIHAKVVRALLGKLNDDGWEDVNALQRDFNGSAKIALIAIERSLDAWSALFQILPEKEDDFLGILSLLDKIRALMTDEFPAAHMFIRPGFDQD